VTEREQREQIATARRALGRKLAAWRTQARLTQQELARRAGYSRSAIASAEKGEPAGGIFWAAADRAVSAGGSLAAGHAAIEAAISAAREHAVRQAQAERAAAAEPAMTPGPSISAAGVAGNACPRCGLPLTVTITLAAPNPSASADSPSWLL
jgi:transcriptional regulator with XRE-family HTH domain